MATMQNITKDVDIQIIKRRLEARKRDITADGRLSKRQLAMAYRGCHGLESQYYALKHLSNDTMATAQHRNERLANRLVKDMKQLSEQERIQKTKADRDLKTLREDFTAQLAYQYVYKNHSFERQYKSQQSKPTRPVSDKPEMYDFERKKSAAREAMPRPLGSLRQLENYKGELRFPPIETHETANIPSPRVNMMGDKNYEDIKQDHEVIIREESKFTSFPSIQGAMAVEIKFKHKVVDDDKGSIISAPPAKLDADSETEDDAEIAELKSQNMARNLLILKLRQQQEFEAPRRLLPSAPASDSKDERKEAWRRILPDPPSRPSTVFTGSTRTAIGVKNQMKREVSNVLENWSHSTRRQELVDKAKERNKTELEQHPMPVIDHQRPISAIFRDYRDYKRQKEDWTREQAADKNTVIIRQMSPQPRVASPVLQRRSDYANRTVTPLTKKRNQAETDTKQEKPLRRTESERSERFTSVSRTSSLRELPEEEIEKINQHAHLTSAERIELERCRLAKLDSRNDNPGNRSPSKAKRRLPSTPASKAKPKSSQNSGTGLAETAMGFSGTVYGQDTAAIKKVNNANETNEEHLDDTKVYKPNESNGIAETTPHVPIIRRAGDTGTGTTTYTEESLHRMKLASILYDRDLWPKLRKRMSFNYDSFTRAPPDRKKQLEIRAKNRKKIQLRNAQLENEMQREKTVTVAQPERPATRVSFCDNVMVIHTL